MEAAVELWLFFMKRFPHRRSAKNAPRRMAGEHREGVRRTVFSHPDFPETGEGFRPSAPASDRIC